MSNWLRELNWFALVASAVFIAVAFGAPCLSAYGARDRQAQLMVEATQGVRSDKVNSAERLKQQAVVGSRATDKGDCLPCVLWVSVKSFFLWSAKTPDSLFAGCVAFFTLLLVIRTFIQARDINAIERAYLFFDFNRAIHGDGDGSDLEVFFVVRNSGKTPGHAIEMFGMIADCLPSKRLYEGTQVNRGTPNIGVPPNVPTPIGSMRLAEGGRVAYGYVKYVDIFKKEHITGFAVEANEALNQWQLAGGSEWNYWD